MCLSMGEITTVWEKKGWRDQEVHAIVRGICPDKYPKYRKESRTTFEMITRV